MNDFISNEEFINNTNARREAIYGYDNDILTKKKRYSDLKDIENHLEDSQFNIDLQGYHYECLFHHGEGKNLYVIYDGARNKTVPGFPRWGYYNLFSGSMLCIEDPMFYKFPDIRLGWFYGTKSLSLIKLSLEIVKAVCRHEGIETQNVIFFSSSGGGYAGIYAATMMEHTLAIALNPQLYIYDWYEGIYNDFFSLGIDLRSEDALMRNNLYPLIAKSNSKFVIIYNSKSKMDFEKHMQPFAKELGVHPEYGIVTRGNVLLWIYEAVGVPKPHSSFETKPIFLYIDYISKAFYYNELTEADKRNVFTINECWREIYLLRKDLKDNMNNFMFLGNGKATFRPPYLQGRITIASKEKAYNFIRAYNLEKGSTGYTIALNNVKCSVPEYTAGFYDFKNKRKLHYEKCQTSSPHVFHCVVGRDAEEIAFVVYAGIAGQCQGQWLSAEQLLIQEYPFGGNR